jgi:hypothetical protein
VVQIKYAKKKVDNVQDTRKSLVEANKPIVELSEIKPHTGKGKVRMAEPMAIKFREVAKKLKDEYNIDIDVQDSWRHPDSQDQQHKKYLENVKADKKVPYVAPSDTSFHTIGYAFDLAQTDKMKQPIVAETLKSIGFVPHKDEWWHWSLEKI